MSTTDTTPAPAEITDLYGDALLETLRIIEDRIAAHTFPRLVVKTYTTPGDDEDTYEGLACPRCGAEDIALDSIVAVDAAERWTHPHEAEGSVLHLDSDGDAEWGGTLYYLHNDDHAVSLPENWTEEWV